MFLLSQRLLLIQRYKLYSRADEMKRKISWLWFVVFLIQATALSAQKLTIKGQRTLQVEQGKSITIGLDDITVEADAELNYPNGFYLEIDNGDHYTVSGNTITPSPSFVGLIKVKIRVTNGKEKSEKFNLEINVTSAGGGGGDGENQKPVITAQASVSTFKGEPITIKLSHLSVTDPDDSYPSDFTLIVLPGPNYTVSGNTITPAAAFVGTLDVKVKVNDGEDDSDVFNLVISVIERGTLQIIGQNPIIIPEDSAYVFRLTDLKVDDPSGTYPAGFTLTLLAGDNYIIEEMTVTPAENYSGNLIVPLRVANGSSTSNTFGALIIVEPVNDPPLFSAFDYAKLSFSPNGTEVLIAKEVRTQDVDDDKLTYAEIQLDTSSAFTFLSSSDTENVRGLFDQNAGLLVFLGDAPLEEYDRAIQSVTFSTTDSLRKEIKIRFRLNDGQSYSAWYTKIISSGTEDIELLIQGAFTPNNDNANDTWVISMQQLPQNTKLELRVYNSKGVLLFESDSFDKSWDGRLNGELLPADSYFYTLMVSDETRHVRKNGTVTILR
jgi:gliding motility-associated-like protein